MSPAPSRNAISNGPYDQTNSRGLGPVLGAFRDPPNHGDWTVLCDATDADGALLIGRWRPEAPDSLAAVTRHTSAFKAILAFETARLAALQGDAE